MAKISKVPAHSKKKKNIEKPQSQACCFRMGFILFLSLLAVLAFCYWSFHHYDRELAALFHQDSHFEFGLAKSTFLSELFEAPLMVVVLILTGLLYLNLKKTSLEYAYYRDAAAIAFLTVFLAGLCTLVVKLLIGRYRPEMLFTQHAYGFVGFNLTNDLVHSMPSGHTCRAFSILLGLTAFSRGKMWPYIAIILASMVGLARLVLTQHYLSDVVMGAYIGIVSFILAKAFIGCCRSATKCHSDASCA